MGLRALIGLKIPEHSHLGPLPTPCTWSFFSSAQSYWSWFELCCRSGGLHLYFCSQMNLRPALQVASPSVGLIPCACVANCLQVCFQTYPLNGPWTFAPHISPFVVSVTVNRLQGPVLPMCLALFGPLKLKKNHFEC